jgi:endoglucanase
LQPASSEQKKEAAVPPILKESWAKYVERFIQADGRVIDHKAGGISTSEGQAYAMLRAVWMQDRATFDKTYRWGINNLNSRVRNDHLWAWKWGKDVDGKWRVLDRAFASDADQDAALALILAWKTWNDREYWNAAQLVLADLWNLGTVRAGQRRFLLAGDSLCKGDICRVNPSYAAPYAYRIFARLDTGRNWNELVDSSYHLLETSAGLTRTHLPPDWLLLDLKDGHLALGSKKDSAFSYDAFRVYWRIALDRDLFHDSRAVRYLTESLTWLTKEWEVKKRLPAVISADGEGMAEYESVEMLAGVAPALTGINSDVADAMYRKIDALYSNGAWSEPDSYSIHTWAWFGTALHNAYAAPFERVRY